MNTTPNSSWFYAQNGARKGPVPFLTLQDLFQQGLSPSSLVWTEGMEQWIPASSIPEVINSGPVSPYAPPVTDIVPADAQSGFDMNLPQLPVPLDIGFCFRQGWKCTLANFGRFGFFLQAVVEKGLGPFDALKYSWKLTKKNGFSLFGFYLLGFLIVLVGLFAFFVGLLWAIPTTWLASLIAFRYLHNGPNSVKILP
jgi:hypothetical protein